MTKESKINAYAHAAAGKASSDYLRQRIMEDALRPPIDAAKDAVALYGVLDAVHQIISINNGQNLLARRLLEDLSRINFEQCLTESKALLEYTSGLVDIDLAYKIKPSAQGEHSHVP